MPSTTAVLWLIFCLFFFLSWRVQRVRQGGTRTQPGPKVRPSVQPFAAPPPLFLALTMPWSGIRPQESRTQAQVSPLVVSVATREKGLDARQALDET